MKIGNSIRKFTTIRMNFFAVMALSLFVLMLSFPASAKEPEYQIKEIKVKLTNMNNEKEEFQITPDGYYIKRIEKSGVQKIVKKGILPKESLEQIMTLFKGESFSFAMQNGMEMVNNNEPTPSSSPSPSPTDIYNGPKVPKTFIKAEVEMKGISMSDAGKSNMEDSYSLDLTEDKTKKVSDLSEYQKALGQAFVDRSILPVYTLKNAIDNQPSSMPVE